MQRRALLRWTAGAGALAAGSIRAAPPIGKGKRLAALILDRREIWTDFPPALSAELAALGWVEGKNLAVQWRYADGDAALLRVHAEELAAAAPDAIVTRGSPATHALQRATRSIPILTGVGDPIGSGFAKTYAAPGGNITGLSWAVVETAQKQLEILRTLLPRLASLVFVISGDRKPFLAEITRAIAAAAGTAKIAVRTALADSEAELQQALQTKGGSGEVAALIFGLNRLVPQLVADTALKARMPTMFEVSGYVEEGGLASYRLNWENQNRRAAAQIDKVFRGEKPAQIPFELPTRAEFVLNRKTARLLGLQIPQALLLRADTVLD
jgi:putative ABC transport system substrate-binding protein